MVFKKTNLEKLALMLFHKNKTLSKKVLIIDGQAGCGKTLFNRILGSTNKIEIYRYSSELENICAFYKYRKISFDSAKFFIETYADETLYSQMMSRNTNFRYTDLSSVFQSSKKKIYFKRLFSEGDSVVPSLINKYQPILHFSTHNILSNSEILFKTLRKKIRFINIVRHPAYMIHQQAMNHIEFKKSSARQLIQTFKFKNHEIPFLWRANPKKYLEIKSPFEKAIQQMYILNQLNTDQEKKIHSLYPKKFLKIPFERFVLDPYPFIKKIEKFLQIKFDKNFYKTLKNEKVPRQKVIEGRDTNIYRKYGWKKGTRNFSEKDEIENKLNEVFKNKISIKYKNLIENLSYDYEQKYMKDFL